jgi:RNA polymerase sigma-70 factor (ECF subfamily)
VADPEPGTDAPDGLGALFLANRAMLLRLLVARLGRREEAEDVLQDMWMKIAHLPARLAGEPIAQPVGYLCRMAINLAADRRIAAARSQARDSGWLDVQPAADAMPGADRHLIARDLLNRVEQVIAAMPPRMQTALRLFRLEECSQREIAVRLGITVSGVEKLLKRAYRQLHDADIDVPLPENSADASLQRRLGEEEAGHGR